MAAGARALRRPPMLGAGGHDRDDRRGPRARWLPTGQVHVGGETLAGGGPGAAAVEDGRSVRVVGVEGLTLKVVKRRRTAGGAA